MGFFGLSRRTRVQPYSSHRLKVMRLDSGPEANLPAHQVVQAINMAAAGDNVFSHRAGGHLSVQV